MFEAASHNIVQACGDDCLNTVPSVFESDDFKLLHVVVKKRRKFFFLSPKYVATPFLLQDLLVDKEKFSPDIQSHILLKDYKKDYKISLKGHAGTKLKAMFEVELGGKDDVNVECDLGDLQKDAVNVPSLIKSLVGQKMDLRHDFVKQVRRNKRKSLCVVVGTVSLTTDCVIEAKTDREGDEKVSVDKLKIATIDEDSSISSNRDKSMVLLKDTILAYDVYELSVRTTGTIEVIMDSEVKGGFGEDLVDGTRVPSPPAEETGISEVFNPLLAADRSRRVLLRRALLDLCLYPTAFTRFCNILSEARRRMKNGEKVFTSVGKLKSEVDVTFDSWLELLKFADFIIQDDKVSYPSRPTVEFDSIYNLLKCLRTETDDTLLVLVSGLTNSLAPALASVLLSGSKNEGVPVTDHALIEIYAEDNAAQKILSHMGFYREGDTLKAPKAGLVRVKALYQVVYSLFDCRR